MSETMTAFGKNIIVRKEEGSKTTPGGIVLPKARHSGWAKVISTGINVSAREILEGTLVLVGDYAGVEVNVNDEVLHVIHEDDIVAYKNIGGSDA